MKSKKKYYAIKEGNGVRNMIVTSWEECSKYVIGYKAEYKGFKTEEEAQEYLKGKEVVTKKEVVVKKVSNKHRGKQVTIDIDPVLYQKFLNRCNNMNMKPQVILNGLMKETIEEWIE